MSIDCRRERKVIRILCAFYGIDPNRRCPGFYDGSPTVCYVSNSQSVIKNLCDGQSRCVLYPEYVANSDISDDCQIWARSLYVQWQCVTSLETAITTTPPTDLSASKPFCESLIKPNGTCSTISPSFPTLIE
jgi:hypothetical protein